MKGVGNVAWANRVPQLSRGKWLELLKEIAPEINRVLVMVNAGNIANASRLQAIEASAVSLVRTGDQPVTQPKRPKAKRPRERYNPYRDYAAAYPWYGGYRRSNNYAFQGYGGFRPF